jgi:hypothetical protein
VHTVWRVDDMRVRLFMERFSTTLADRNPEEEPDAIVTVGVRALRPRAAKNLRRTKCSNGMDWKSKTR